jgi:hypothetical protein
MGKKANVVDIAFFAEISKAYPNIDGGTYINGLVLKELPRYDQGLRLAFQTNVKYLGGYIYICDITYGFDSKPLTKILYDKKNNKFTRLELVLDVVEKYSKMTNLLPKLTNYFILTYPNPTSSFEMSILCDNLKRKLDDVGMTEYMMTYGDDGNLIGMKIHSEHEIEFRMDDYRNTITIDGITFYPCDYDRDYIVESDVNALVDLFVPISYLREQKLKQLMDE